MRLRLTAVALLAAASCVPETVSDGPAWVGLPGPDTVSGVVRLVGNEPFSYAMVSGDDTVAVTGEYSAEIERLSGAEVRLTGRITEGGELPARALEASSYEILSVDGEVPQVGVLSQREDVYTLIRSDGESVDLIALSERLRASLGARVWVTLDENGGVARYGILRPAAP